MIDVSIDVPVVDIHNMGSILQRYADHFNGNISKAVNKATVKIIVALRAANTTMRSKDARKIVRKTTKSKYGKYTRQQMHIAEAYAKKEGVPFVDKTTAKFAIERFTQGGVKYIPLFHSASGRDMTSIADAKGEAIKFHAKQYWIKKPYGKQGLARSSWAWMLKRLNAASTSEIAEINGVVSVDKSDRISGGVRAYEITATNKLNYIRHALKANVSSFMNRAGRMMISEMEGYKRSASASVGRAAA